MKEEDPEIIANRREQEKIVAAIQQEKEPSRHTKLVGRLLELIYQRRILLQQVKPVEISEISDERRKTGQE